MQIPTNHITDYAEGGVSLRNLTMGGKASHLTGLHRDDYYLFCLLTRGELHLSVDFSEQVIHAHQIGCILPGHAGRGCQGTRLPGDRYLADTKNMGLLTIFAK